jgi:hypothetical protein
MHGLLSNSDGMLMSIGQDIVGIKNSTCVVLDAYWFIQGFLSSLKIYGSVWPIALVVFAG